MLAPAVTAIRAYIAANYSALPIRWQNENWTGTNPQDTASPFIEVEIIGGRNAIHSTGSPGANLFIHPGLIRFYVFAPANTGMTAAMATADALAAFMERKEFGQSAGRTVRTLDFSTYDNIATNEEGNFLVLCCSCPFDFYYNN